MTFSPLVTLSRFPLFVFSCLVAVTASGSSVDNFERSDGSLGAPWQVAGEAFRIEHGAAVQAQEGVNLAVWSEGALETGFRAEVKVTFAAPAGATAPYVGLAFHVHGPEDYYTVRFNAAGRVQVLRVREGEARPIYNRGNQFTFRRMQPLRLSVTGEFGGRWSFALADAEDGTILWRDEVIVEPEATPQGGFAALYAAAHPQGAPAYFDDFRVEQGAQGPAAASLAPAATSLPASARLSADAPNIIIFFTDDQGYADLGAQGMRDDIRTPHLDRLAAEGVRFTHGYVTAPVCGPSRAGLLSGQYQQRFGVETNAELPFVYGGTPIPERLRQAGYRTGMAGKLHLPLQNRPGGENPAEWGFEEYSMMAGHFQSAPKRRLMTHFLDGSPRPRPQWKDVDGYRFELSTDFAVQFIERNQEQPFFLYVAYFGPHTPLKATEEYLARFPEREGVWMPPARRYALAMMAAIDDGVGRIEATLARLGLSENTLIFFSSDNGAPLKGQRELPVEQLELNEWNGSRNDPLRAEKGMLGEGGIRVPFLLKWPAQVPGGQVVAEPVITLDIGATVLAVNQLPLDDLGGVDLMPLITRQTHTLDRSLYWMFGGQTAIRRGPWKLLRSDFHGPYLFDLTQPEPERVNRIEEFPELAARLEADLESWMREVGHRALPHRPLINLIKSQFDEHYGDL